MKIPSMSLLAVTVVILLFINGSLSLRVQKSSEQLLFESFIFNYSKEYKNDYKEMSYKFEVFQQSLARQKVLNDYEKLNGGTARFGVNKFSDLTPEEFKQIHLSPQRKILNNRPIPKSTLHFSVPNKTRFDWRDHGVIGPIRDQRKCGSCWAFAVVETITSAYAIEHKQKLQHILSSQQVISCDFNPSIGLNGCGGGSLPSAMQSLKKMGMVLVDDSVYPFKSKKGENLQCQGGLPNKGVKLTKFMYFDRVSVSTMTLWLKFSPLATSVNAIPWQDYIGGIVQHHCSDEFVDHAVQIVGYDFTGDLPYWIVRNSWGPDWGEKGYIRILHSNSNLCGLQDEVVVVSGTVGVNL